MRIALMSDIHSNREAFEACLRDARTRGIDRIALLGDYVGYGADPVWVTDTVMELVSNGSAAIMGNHDHAVSYMRENLNTDAEVAITWTRGQLGPAEREFLATLNTRCEDDTRLYVHADVQPGRSWNYIDGSAAAERALKSCGAQMVVCGHVHKPALYGITATGKIASFRPVSGVAIPVPRHRRWLAVLGSVGQPRDGNPSASYTLLDTDKSEIIYLRVPYDITTAAEKIRAAGLPENLAARLQRGR